MTVTSIIEGVRAYLLRCPCLEEGVIHVDYQGLTPVQYNLETLERGESLVKAYIDGTSLRQFIFRFSSTQWYGADVRLNLENSSFYEKFSSWLLEQNHRGNLPNLGAGKDALAIEPLSSGILYESGEDTAKYQITCQILYYDNYNGGRKL